MGAVQISGADLAAMAKLKADFDGWAKSIDQVTAGATSAMSSLEQLWQGEDSAAFKADWVNVHRPKLRLATTELREAADVIEKNRAEQEVTSEADGAFGAPGGPLPPGGGNGAGDRTGPGNQPGGGRPGGDGPAARPGEPGGGGHPGDGAPQWAREPGQREDRFPLQTWQIEGEASAKVWRIVDAGFDGDYELVQLSDGTYDIKIQNGTHAGFGIPLTGFGADMGSATGLTFNLTVEELAYLQEQGFPIPGDAVPPGIDTSGVSFNPVDNISGISVEHNLEAAIDGIGIPILPSTDVVDRLTDFDFPDSLDIEGETMREYHIRRADDGSWEVAASVTATGEVEITTDHESQGGWVGGVVDFTTPVDLDKITTTGTSVEVQQELIFNVESGEFVIKETTSTTTFESEGGEFGLDIPGTDEIFGGPSHTVGEVVDGTTTTTTTETVRSIDGDVISEQTTESDGTFRRSGTDFIFSDAEIESSYEGHSPPQDAD